MREYFDSLCRAVARNNLSFKKIKYASTLNKAVNICLAVTVWCSNFWTYTCRYIWEFSDCEENGGRQGLHVVLTHSSNFLNSSASTVYTDPWIACPIDRVEELEPDKSTVVLGYKWQLPRTNMKIVTVSPSSYDENYPFPVGRHRVTWIGTSDSGTQKSCSFYVTVNGRLD